ncbi:cysteine desulfurase [Candidatus Woesearchaeota archaeon]|nr:cysteine desulfurase [Candidatus Woesearchaeota archaeon]
MKTIYLDNAATTKIDPEVVKAMNIYHQKAYGNASSQHHKGQEAKRALEESRHTIAKSINAKDDEIYFTSGGTESNNWALMELFFANPKKNHIITTKIEHDCILNTCKLLEKLGARVTYCPVDKKGFVSPVFLEKLIKKDTLVVSVIHGNNEIGTIQDLEAIYKVCKKHKVLFHTDACQSYTKTSLSAKHADLITLNAHKIHGPKGVGALFIKKGVKMNPLIQGGGQERGMRSGTENIPSIVGFAKAVKQAKSSDINKMTKLRDYFIEQLLTIPDTRLNGPKKNRLCNNINISFRYIEGESIGSFLDAKGICTSTGSACSSFSLEPSHVIMALEPNPERAHGSLRFSISKYTTKQDLDFTIKNIKSTVNKLRKISPLTKIMKKVL